MGLLAMWGVYPHHLRQPVQRFPIQSLSCRASNWSTIGLVAPLYQLRGFSCFSTKALCNFWSDWPGFSDAAVLTNMKTVLCGTVTSSFSIKPQVQPSSNNSHVHCFPTDPLLFLQEHNDFSIILSYLEDVLPPKRHTSEADKTPQAYSCPGVNLGGRVTRLSF